MYHSHTKWKEHDKLSLNMVHFCIPSCLRPCWPFERFVRWSTFCVSKCCHILPLLRRLLYPLCNGPTRGEKFLKFLTERSTSIHKLYHLHIEKFGKVFGHEERMLQQIEAAEEKPNDGWWKKPQWCVWHKLAISFSCSRALSVFLFQPSAIMPFDFLLNLDPKGGRYRR